MTFSLPAYSPASSSTTGAIARHGAHQGAQKSIRTGVELWSTSRSNESSATGCTVAVRPPSRDDRKRVRARDPTSAGEAHHVWGAGPDVDPTLDGLGTSEAHRDRVRPLGEREPATVERRGGEPEAAVQVDRGPV